MTYSLRFVVGGFDFTVAENTIDDLLEQYGQMGGDPKWLLTQVQSIVPDLEISVDLHNSRRDEANAEADSEAKAEADSASSSAWDNDGPWSRRKPSGDKERRDPWDDAPVDEKPAVRRTAPSRGNSEDTYTKTDSFGRQWTLGLPDAPTCDCGEPAARMKGKAGPQSRNPGKPYTVFKCAKGAPDGDWRSKCDFSEFPS